MNYYRQQFCLVPDRDDSIADLPMLARAMVTYIAKQSNRGDLNVRNDCEVADAIVKRCGGSHHDVAVVRRLLPHAMNSGVLSVSRNQQDACVTVRDFIEWQATPRRYTRRLYSCEFFPFAGLSFVARSVASYCVKRCNDAGRFAGVATTSDLVARLFRIGGSSDGKREADRRVATGAIEALLAEGFLVVDGGDIVVKNFAAAQESAQPNVWIGIRAHVVAEVYERDGNRCVYCGATENLSLDHVLPRTRGGKHKPDNLVTACCPCNSSKGERTPDEWVNRPPRCIAYAAMKNVSVPATEGGALC